MDKGQQHTVRPPSFLRVEERATRVMQAVTRGVTLPPERAHLYRKWRAKDGRTSPLERVEQNIVELHGLGVPVATLRRIPRLFDELLNDLSCGTARPRLTSEAITAEVALEAIENTLAMRLALGERTPETLIAYADALDAEATHQHELARAARHEARALQRNA